VLVLAWLIATLRPGYPLLLLALYGAQGTAKSTAARLLASLVDPVKAPLRSEPRNEHDLMIAARNQW
jgi:Mg-chelatase subunit ChlI